MNAIVQPDACHPRTQPLTESRALVQEDWPESGNAIVRSDPKQYTFIAIRTTGSRTARHGNSLWTMVLLALVSRAFALTQCVRRIA
jgi:hypothetical protein